MSAVSLPATSLRALKALDCPPELFTANSFSLEDAKRVIHWLEKNVLRILSEADCAKIVDPEVSRQDWLKRMSNYFRQLGIAKAAPPGSVPSIVPIDTEPALRRWVLIRLIDISVQDALQDVEEAEELDIVDEEFVIRDAAEDIQCSMKEVSSPIAWESVIKNLNVLLAKCGLPAVPSSGDDAELEAMAASALCAIKTRLIPPEDKCGSLENERPILPLSIPENCVKTRGLKDVFTALRLAHVEELSKVQRGINRVLTDLQSVTANPITDTKYAFLNHELIVFMYRLLCFPGVDVLDFKCRLPASSEPLCTWTDICKIQNNFEATVEAVSDGFEPAADCLRVAKRFCIDSKKV